MTPDKFILKDWWRMKLIISYFTISSPKIEQVKWFGTDRHPNLLDWVACNLTDEWQSATADQIVESAFEIVISGILNGTDKEKR